VIRKLETSLLAVIALIPAINTLCEAQSPPPLTRHVRNVTVTGEAKSVGRLPAAQPMRLTLSLPLSNEAALDSLLQNLYDPSSPSYHKFLSVEEFTAMYGPSQSDYDAVVSFAHAHGLAVVGTSRNRLNVDVTGPVANVEEALHVTMGLYQHPTENRTFYAADREPTPDMPVRLWHISGLDNYSIPQPLLVRRPQGVEPAATTGSCPSKSFCGSDMRLAYYGATALTGRNQSLGLLEYVGTDLADLGTYYTNANQTLNAPIKLVSTDGTSTSCLASQGCDDTEQTIDMTQALGMAPNLALLVMYVGSSDAAIFNAMATASPLNAQLSSSWGWSPADPSTDNPYFKEFAAQGQNLFQAAGDSGAWGPNSTLYPADDPYLVSVGGTDLVTASAGGPWASETAWANGGGGISGDKFPIPAWQVAAAAQCSVCSQTYRNSPDVSANANYTFYVCADQTTCSANAYGGTSFAAPMWAGFLALANEQSVANTGTTLGFINPSIYNAGLSSTYDNVFHDITGGSNGYSATIGYDLATGWGTPMGEPLINTLNGKIGPGFSLSASPNAITLLQNNSGTSTITSTVTDKFNSAIALTATGQPTGVTVSFGPTSITGAGTSTMTITVGATVIPGTYTIIVTGTSGGASASTSFALTVKGTATTFYLTASPSTQSVGTLGQVTYTVTSQISGSFDAAVTLSASGQGSSEAVKFAPVTIAAPGAGKSTMTVSVGQKAPKATYTITITGTGGGITQTTTVTLNVVD
jgi:subtilase family serine protease